MPSPHGMVYEVILFLIAAIIAALLARRIRASPIIGYLLAGVVIGPDGFGLVRLDDPVRVLAEFGIVFLMFSIGLEISFSRLKTMRGFVFGLGGLQVALTATALAGLALLFGMKGNAAAVTGLALALSSTAVVARLLIDQGALASKIGRRAFGILLFQDMAVAPILLLVAALANDAPVLTDAAFIATGEAALAIIFVLAAGHYLARPLFRAVASLQTPEVFVAATLLVVLGAAMLMEQVGLSMALGAFLAGLLLSETEYATQIELDIGPFRGLLLGLFFLSVGMGLDTGYLLGAFDRVLLFLLALLLIKTLIIVLLSRFFDLSPGGRWRLALLLAQGGEFAFVVFALAGALGLVAANDLQMMTVAVGLSIALTPLLAALGRAVEQRLLADAAVDAADAVDLDRDIEGHVVIAGCGRVGRTVARLLCEQRVGYVVIDRDPELVARAAASGQPVFYGNSASPEILNAAGLTRAAALVITLNDRRAALKTVEAARRLAPGLRIIARAHDLAHGLALEREGASVSVPETLEASLQLGAQTLRDLGISHGAVDEVIDRLRQDDYALIRDVASNPAED